MKAIESFALESFDLHTSEHTHMNLHTNLGLYKIVSLFIQVADWLCFVECSRLTPGLED
jgi:hypothetical protein